MPVAPSNSRTPTPTEHGIITAVAAIVPPLMDKVTGGMLGTCISSSRVAQRTLRAFHISAKPVSVEVLTLNREAARLHAAGVPRAQWPHGARWAGIGQRGSGYGPGWEGHLLLHLPDLDVLLDPSSAQFRMPADRLVAPDCVVREQTPPPSTRTWTRVPLKRGELCYRAAPGNDEWRRSASWTSHQSRDIADHIIQGVRSSLDVWVPAA